MDKVLKLLEELYFYRTEDGVWQKEFLTQRITVQFVGEKMCFCYGNLMNKANGMHFEVPISKRNFVDCYKNMLNFLTICHNHEENALDNEWEKIGRLE